MKWYSMFLFKCVVCFFACFVNNYAIDSSTTIYSIVGAFVQSDANMLPSLQNVPGNNPVVNALAIAGELDNIAGTSNSMTIRGDVEWSGNTMRISVHTSIENIQISGSVFINMPIGGILFIDVDGTPYGGSIDGLTIRYQNAAQNFDIKASQLQIIGSLTTNNFSSVTIEGSLLVSPRCVDIDYISLEAFSTLTVTNDILFDGLLMSWICNSGTIQSTSGDILIRNHESNSTNGIFNKGIISASMNHSLTFQDNDSLARNGVLIYTNSTIEAGSLIFKNNHGVMNGVNMLGNVYAESVMITINCIDPEVNESFVFAVNVYEYSDRSIVLPPSQITVNNSGDCPIGGGTLTTEGSIQIASDTMTITDDVSITGLVVIGIPTSGTLLINGTPYTGTIAGLVVIHNQTSNNFTINGALVATTLDVAGTVIVASGITMTGLISVTSGGLTLSDNGRAFSAGAGILVSSGALCSIGSGLESCAITGNIVGVGATITLGSQVIMTGTISAQTLNMNDDVTTSGSVTVTGGSLTIAQNKICTVASLTHDGSNNSGTFFNGFGATLVATVGNIIIQQVNNDQGDAVATGTITASSGNITITNNMSTTTYSSGVFVCGNISGVNIVIDTNSGNTGVYAYVFDPHITATGTLSISGNAANVNFGDGFFLYGNAAISGALGIVMSNNSSLSGHGIYQSGSSITTPVSLTMNNNSGNSGGVLMSEGTLDIGSTSSVSVIISGSNSLQNVNCSGASFYDSSGNMPLSVIGGSIISNATGGCTISFNPLNN